MNARALAALLLLVAAAHAGPTAPPPPPDDEAPPSFYSDDLPKPKPLQRDEAVKLYACTLLPSCGTSLPRNMTKQLDEYLGNPDNAPDKVKSDGYQYFQQAKAEYEAKQGRTQTQQTSPSQQPQQAGVPQSPPSQGAPAVARDPNTGSSQPPGPADLGISVPGGAGSAPRRSAELDRSLSEQKGIGDKADKAASAGSRLQSAFASAFTAGADGAAGALESGAPTVGDRAHSQEKAARFAAPEVPYDALNQRTAGEVRTQVPAARREALLGDYASDPAAAKFKDLAPVLYKGSSFSHDGDLKTLGFTRRCAPPEDCNKFATYPYKEGQLARAETLNKMPTSAEEKKPRGAAERKADRSKLASLWSAIGDRLAQARGASASGAPSAAPRRAIGGTLASLLARLSGKARETGDGVRASEPGFASASAAPPLPEPRNRASAGASASPGPTSGEIEQGLAAEQAGAPEPSRAPALAGALAVAAAAGAGAYFFLFRKRDE